MGGGTIARVRPRSLAWDLSPRGRGNHFALALGPAHTGSIPAWAGEPRTNWSGSVLTTVYPRVGGGTSLSWTLSKRSKGLSPRGRGNRNRLAASPHRARSIPAWAGEPGLPTIPAAATWVYPRVGGGTDSGTGNHQPRGGLSPRGRGNQRIPHTIGQGARSIPAWAGEPVATRT